MKKGPNPVNTKGKRYGPHDILATGRWKYNHEKRHREYQFYCPCGKIFYAQIVRVKRGDYTSCGCKKKQRSKLSRVETFIRNRYGSYLNRAFNKDMLFTLTFNEFMSIVISPCHYCGHKPTLEKNGKTTYEINTVDRKYSKEGYVKGNCLPCCVKCNISKMDMPYEDFLQHVEKIFNHIKGG